jgi:hypothetical protein
VKLKNIQQERELSYKAIGFEPNETPIGSLKDPILIPPKLRIRFNHKVLALFYKFSKIIRNSV